MKLHSKFASSIFSLLLILLAINTHAQSNCAVTINSLPFVIDQNNKTYCLGRSILYNPSADTPQPGKYTVSTGDKSFGFISAPFTAAIVVKARNVTLDLNGYSIYVDDFNLKPNQVAVGVYGIDVETFNLLHGEIRGFDVGAYVLAGIFTPPSLRKSTVTFDQLTIDKAKLTALYSSANDNLVTNNRVTSFDSRLRWPTATINIMDFMGGGYQGDTTTVINNAIFNARTTYVDPLPNDGKLFWGTNGISVYSENGDITIANNQLLDILVPNGVATYLSVTGRTATINNNRFVVPMIKTRATPQNIAIAENSPTITKADSNYFFGINTLFWAFNPTPLNYSNNTIHLFNSEAGKFPLILNYGNKAVDGGGNKFIWH